MLTSKISELRGDGSKLIKYHYCQLGTMDNELLLFVADIRTYYESTRVFHKLTPLAIKKRILQAFKDENIVLPTGKFFISSLLLVEHGKYMNKKLNEINGVFDLY